MSARSAGYALTWEYWRRGMRWFVPAIVGLTIGFLLLSLPFHRAAAAGFGWAEVGAQLRNVSTTPFRFWIGFVLAIASWTAMRRHYTLPVATATLVGWSLMNGALAAAAVYAGTALAINGALSADWPVLMPALGAAAIYVAFQAVFWWIGPSRGVYGVLAVILAVALAVASDLHLLPLTRFSVFRAAWAWAQTAAGSLVLSIGTILLAYAAAVNGVARDRRGEAWSLEWLGRWCNSLADAVSRRSRRRAHWRFRSPESAQFWLEWRGKGRLLPLCVAGIVCGVWVFPAVASLEPYDVSALVVSLTATSVFLSPLIGVFLGAGSGGFEFDMKSFAATRPMSDSGLAAAVLRSTALALGTAATLWLVGAVTTLAIWVPEDWQRLQNSWHDGLWAFHSRYGEFVLMIALMCWTLAGLGASLALSRQWFVGWAGVGLIGFLLIFAWSMDRLPREIATVLTAVVAAGCLGGTLVAWIVAHRRQLTSGRTLLIGLSGYLLLLVYLYGGTPLIAVGSPVTHFVVVCFSAIPFAPFAAAPLALSWNRHR